MSISRGQSVIFLAICGLVLLLFVVGRLGHRRAASELAGPRFEVARSVELGYLPLADTVPIEIPFRNTGAKRLRIYRVDTSCGCVAAKLDKDTFAAGESGTLKFRYHTGGGAGRTVSVTAYVRSNDPGNPTLTLQMRGMMTPAVIASPRSMQFGRVELGSTAVREMTVVAAGGAKEFGVKNVRSDIPLLHLSISKSGALASSPGIDLSQAYVLVAKLEAKGAPKVLDGKIFIETTLDSGEPLNIPVSARLESSIKAAPTRLLWQTSAKQPTARELVITVTSPIPIEMRPLQPAPIKTMVETEGPSRVWRFRCRPERDDVESTDGFLRFSIAGHPAEETFEIPFSIVRIPSTKQSEAGGDRGPR